MSTKPLLGAALLIAIALSVPSLAAAQLTIRVSVKLFYDDTVSPPIPPGGDIEPADGIEDADHCGKLISPEPSGCDNSGTAISCDAEIQEKFEYVNTLLLRMRRGYQFELPVEIVHLTDPPTPPIALGVSAWTFVDPGSEGQDSLDAAAFANPGAFAYRTDALNVYVFDCNGGGRGDPCAVSSENRTITTSQGAGGSWTRFLHEICHFLGLNHTFRTPTCDGICDTANDIEGGSIDDVALNAFGGPLLSLTCEQQEQVFDLYYNIMSYHADDAFSDDCRQSDPTVVACGNDNTDGLCRHRLTTDQLDLITNRLNNLDTVDAVSGRTVFVIPNPNPSCVTAPCGTNLPCGTCPCDHAPRAIDGTPVMPHPTIAAGLADAATTTNRDVVLIRAGSYPEGLTINQRVTLRATRGVVIIGSP